MPRGCSSRDGAGLVNVPALKGIHYAVESGCLAAEAAFGALQPGRRRAPGGLQPYDDAVRESFIWNDLEQVRNMRQAFGRGFYLGGMMAGAMTASLGKFPPGNAKTERDAEQPLFRTGRARSYPAPTEAHIRQALERLPEWEQDARRRAEPHPHQAPRPARARRGVGAYVPGAGLRAGGGDGEVEVEVTPSNCVQCGAITAKGGRLTPPEGGSGPEYTLT